MIKKRFISMLVLLAAVVTGAMAQNYKVSVKEGTEDATSWTIAPAEATTTGVAAGTEVKATYGGTKKVKSVKAVKKAKPAATVTTAPTAKTGVKAGEDVAIVNAGTAEGGTMMYMVNATQPASTDGFSATVPTAEGLTAGTYYVWYYVKADDTHTDSEISASGIEVEIDAAATVLVTTITLNKTSTTIKLGQTETLSVTAVLPANATDKTYTWKSDNAGIAKVDQDGNVTARSIGQVTIYAEANDGSGVKGICNVACLP